MKPITIEITFGELVDRHQIAGVKLANLKSIKTSDIILEAINCEYIRLAKIKAGKMRGMDDFKVTYIRVVSEKLEKIHRELWNLENRVRNLDLGLEFKNNAKRIFELNTARSIIKQEINLMFDQEALEYKQYN